MNVSTLKRVDPEAIGPLRRTYLRDRLTAHEPMAPRVVAAVTALALAGLVLLL